MQSDLLADAFALHRAGQLDAAAGLYRACLAHDPAQVDARHLLGLALHQSGNSEAALPHLAEAVALRPEIALFHANLGIAHLAAGDPVQAEPALRRALALAPGVPDTLHNLGVALLRLDRAHEAARVLRDCLAADPSAIDARINLAAALLLCAEPDTAAGLLRQALAACPHSVSALCGLAAALGPVPEAEDCLRLAHRLAPADPGITTRLGNLLRERDQLAESDCLLAAIAVSGTADALHNHAMTQVALGRLDAAEAGLRRALAAEPGHADAAYTLGTTLLLSGRLREGWPGLEQRWKRRGFAEPWRFTVPRWQGEADGTLLLHAEQGLGDAIQMLRFVPALAARRKVVLAVPPALLRLCQGLAPIVTTPDRLPDFDRHCPLMSLPAMLGVGTDDLAASAPYLRADPLAAATWRARLADLPGHRIGIAWAGNPAYPADHRRSLPAAALAGLAQPGTRLVSLQKGAAAPDGVIDWTPDLADLADTAALIEALDLVISVDTAVAHLAGALGRPVWLLNRFDPCWRWQLGRADSPWYPSLRQFRQPAPGDWGSVLDSVRAALAQPGTVCAASTAASMVTPNPGPSGTWITPPAAWSTSAQMS